MFEWKMNPYAFFASGINFSKKDMAASKHMNDYKTENY